MQDPKAPVPVEDPRRLAVREAHKNLKRHYTNPIRARKLGRVPFVKLSLVERHAHQGKTRTGVKEYIQATAHGGDQYLKDVENKFECDDILTHIGSDPGKRVLISGPAGSGKTALAHILCRDLYSGHLPNQYQLVLFAELKAFRTYLNTWSKKDPSFYGFLEYSGLRKADIIYSLIAEECGRGVAVILDGYDEISNDKKLSECVTQLFSSDVPFTQVSQCDVFITARPSQLSHFTRSSSTHLEILDFPNSDIEHYINAYFDTTPLVIEEAIRRITIVPPILGLCRTPKVLDISCRILKHLEEYPLPDNLSGLFLRFLCYQMEAHLMQRDPPVKVYVKDLLRVPAELFEGFYPLCSLAYQCCLCQQFVLEKHDLGEIQTCIDGRGSVYNLLFGEVLDSPSEIPCMLFHCCHKTVMEALAAVHIAVLTPAEQQQIWEEWFPAPHMAQVWLIYCGLTGLKSVNLRKLCSLAVSERAREVVTGLQPGAFDAEDRLLMLSLHEACQRVAVLPALLRTGVRASIECHNDARVVANTISQYVQLPRCSLDLSGDLTGVDLQPLTASLRSVKAIELRCWRTEPMLAVLPRSVEELSLYCSDRPSLAVLGAAVRDLHYLRSLTVSGCHHPALLTELASVLGTRTLTEFHLKYSRADNFPEEALKNLLVHREKCSLDMRLSCRQLSAVLSGLKRAARLRELSLTVTRSKGDSGQCDVSCGELEELVAAHPRLVKVDVESLYEQDDLILAVAKGAVRNKNVTHIGLGGFESRAVHPLLCSPLANHITSVRATYQRGDGGDGESDDDWVEAMIAGPMARHACHLDLRGMNPASFGLLLSRVNTATKLRELSVALDDTWDNQESVDLEAVEAAFLKCNLRKLRIDSEHWNAAAPWYPLYVVILNGLAANTTVPLVDTCIYGSHLDELTALLSWHTLARFEVVGSQPCYVISRDLP